MVDKQGKPPVLVVLQLTGGNDYFNTVIPYTDENYFDSRKSIQISLPQPGKGQFPICEGNRVELF